MIRFDGQSANNERAHANNGPDRLLLVLFTVFWLAVIAAYGLGFATKFNSYHVKLPSLYSLGFMMVLILPLIVVWALYFRSVNGRGATTQASQASAMGDAGKASAFTATAPTNAVRDANFGKSGATMIDELEPALFPDDILGEPDPIAYDDIPAAVSPRQTPNVVPAGSRDIGGHQLANERDDIAARLDAPELPIAARSEVPVSIETLALVLNFDDESHEGEWKTSFKQVRDNGYYLGLVQHAERVLEIFEGEGVYVEDLGYRDAGAQTWRRLVAGERGIEIKELATVRDRTAIAVIQSRSRIDAEAKELFLTFQKRFLMALEELVPSAPDDAIDKLAIGRAGRCFSILSQISGIVPKAFA